MKKGEKVIARQEGKEDLPQMLSIIDLVIAKERK